MHFAGVNVRLDAYMVQSLSWKQFHAPSIQYAISIETFNPLPLRRLRHEVLEK